MPFFVRKANGVRFRLDENELLDAVQKGQWWQFDPEDKPTIRFVKQGEVSELPFDLENIQAAISQGWSPEDERETIIDYKVQQAEKDTLGPIKAAAASATNVATLGLAKLAYPEEYEVLERANPITSATTEIAGSIAAAISGVGAAKTGLSLAKGLKAGLPGISAQVAERAAMKAGVLGKIGAYGAAGAAEGAVLSGSDALQDMLVYDKKTVADVAKEMVSGGLWGAIFAGVPVAGIEGVGLLGRGIKKAYKKVVPDTWDEFSEKASKPMSWATGLREKEVETFLKNSPRIIDDVHNYEARMQNLGKELADNHTAFAAVSDESRDIYLDIKKRIFDYNNLTNPDQVVLELADVLANKQDGILATMDFLRTGAQRSGHDHDAYSLINRVYNNIVGSAPTPGTKKTYETPELSQKGKTEYASPGMRTTHTPEVIDPIASTPGARVLRKEADAIDDLAKRIVIGASTPHGKEQFIKNVINLQTQIDSEATKLGKRLSKMGQQGTMNPALYSTYTELKKASDRISDVLELGFGDIGQKLKSLKTNELRNLYQAREATGAKYGKIDINGDEIGDVAKFRSMIERAGTAPEELTRYATILDRSKAISKKMLDDFDGVLASEQKKTLKKLIEKQQSIQNAFSRAMNNGSELLSNIELADTVRKHSVDNLSLFHTGLVSAGWALGGPLAGTAVAGIATALQSPYKFGQMRYVMSRAHKVNSKVLDNIGSLFSGIGKATKAITSRGTTLGWTSAVNQMIKEQGYKDRDEAYWGIMDKIASISSDPDTALATSLGDAATASDDLRDELKSIIQSVTSEATKASAKQYPQDVLDEVSGKRPRVESKGRDELLNTIYLISNPEKIIDAMNSGVVTQNMMNIFIAAHSDLYTKMSQKIMETASKSRPKNKRSMSVFLRMPATRMQENAVIQYLQNRYVAEQQQQQQKNKGSVKDNEFSDMEQTQIGRIQEAK